MIGKSADAARSELGSDLARHGAEGAVGACCAPFNLSGSLSEHGGSCACGDPRVCARGSAAGQQEPEEGGILRPSAQRGHGVSAGESGCFALALASDELGGVLQAIRQQPLALPTGSALTTVHLGTQLHAEELRRQRGAGMRVLLTSGW